MVKISKKQEEVNEFNDKIDSLIKLLAETNRKSIIFDFQNPPKEYTYSASGCTFFTYKSFSYDDAIIFLNQIKK
jgi:CRISPR/Cas system CMR-associated protein Cmr1 (group 7 of RAMP superfamily)